MNKSLAIPSKHNGMGLYLPGSVTLNYLSLPDNLPFEEWQQVGKILRQIESGNQWWTGDWLNFGEGHYGEMYSQELQDQFGVGYEALSHYKWLSRQFEFCTRVQNVSWAHHRIVASKKIAPKDRAIYLRAARLYELTYDQFDSFVRKHEKKKRLRSYTDGLPDPEEYVPEIDFRLDSIQVADIDELRLPSQLH